MKRLPYLTLALFALNTQAQVGTWSARITDGGTCPAADAGSNRLYVAAIGQDYTPGGGGGPTISSVTIGGAAAAQAVQLQHSGGNQVAALYYIAEADIDAGTMVVDVTWSSAPDSDDDITIRCATVQNVRQASPVVDSGSGEGADITLSSLSTVLDGYAIGVSIGGASTNSVSGWTDLVAAFEEAYAGFHVFAGADDGTDGTSIAPAIDWNLTHTGNVLVAATFAPSACLPCITSLIDQGDL